MSEDPGNLKGSRRFAENTAWTFAGQIGGKVAGFVFFVIVARVLGVREYGFFNFAISFVPLFLSFGGLGLDSITIRELAKTPARTAELVASALVIRSLVGAIGLLLSIGVGTFLLADPVALTTLAVVGLALLFDDITGVYTAMFRAFERMRFYALAKALNRTLSTVLAAATLLFGGGLVAVVGAYLVGSVATLVWSWTVMIRHFPRVRMRDRSAAVAKELFREGRALGVAGMLNLALFRIDTVMVEAIRGATGVGLYGVAYRFFESFLFVPQALMTVGLPRVAKQRHGEAARGTFEVLIAFALAFHLPIALAAPFVADWLVTALFTERYAAAAEAVPWLTGAALFYAVTFVARGTAIGLGEGRRITTIAAVALTINVALNVYLIPREGFVGAAIATFVVEVLEAVLTMFVLRMRGLPAFRIPLALVPILSSVVMWLVLWIGGLRNATALGVGTCVYALVLVAAARSLAPEKTALAIRVLRRPRSEAPSP